MPDAGITCFHKEVKDAYRVRHTSLNSTWRGLQMKRRRLKAAITLDRDLDLSRIFPINFSMFISRASKSGNPYKAAILL